MMRCLIATITANGTVNFADQNGNTPNPGVAGLITDVELLVTSGTDNSLDISIKDSSSSLNAFAVTSVDATSGLQYKVDNAAIKRNSVVGTLTATGANITSSTVVVKVWIQE